VGRIALPVPFTAKARAPLAPAGGTSARTIGFEVYTSIIRRHMRSAKTSKGHHAFLAGVTLALTLTGAMLRAQQAEPQEPTTPAQPQTQQASARVSPEQQERSPLDEALAQLPAATISPAPIQDEGLHALVRRPLVVSSPARIIRISVSDPNIIDTVVLSRNQILINGRTLGRASLVVGDATGQSQEFDINVDSDAPGLDNRSWEDLPDPPPLTIVQKGMISWVVWVVVAAIVLGAAAILIGMRQRKPRLNTLELQARDRVARSASSEPKAAGSPDKAVSKDSSVEEAMIDGLTGLKTYRYFMEALDEEWRVSARSGRPFSVIMIDLDRFKEVNDRKGKSEGDRVLEAVGTLLDARSREPDVVARYGSDEFAILMPETNTHQAEIMAEKLRAAVEMDHLLRAHTITASIGIASFPDHGRTPEETLKVADSEVSLAKNSSGNCVKVASLSPKPGNAERNERLLETYLEAAVRGIPALAPDAFNGDQRKRDQMKPALDSLIALAFAVEVKGPYLRGHARAVSRLAARIAVQVGLSPTEVEETRLAGLVHDIGKLHVPETVCNKPAQLTPEELETMRSHPAWGAKMLEPLDVKAIEQIVLHHHERYDGKGYPEGLSGDKIPMGARILAVAECFHSMVSDLPYRSARSFEDALAELRRGSGIQFDPKVVMTFLEWLQVYYVSPKQL